MHLLTNWEVKKLPSFTSFCKLKNSSDYHSLLELFKFTGKPMSGLNSLRDFVIRFTTKQPSPTQIEWLTCSKILMGKLRKQWRVWVSGAFISQHHWEERSIILTSSRSNLWLFCMECWANKEFSSPVKITLLCSVVLDLRALDVWLI